MTFALFQFLLLPVMSIAAQSDQINIPLNEEAQWEDLSFSGIPKNICEFEESGLKIKVKNSASPLIFRLTSPTAVHRVSARGLIHGALDLRNGKQGEKDYDDFLFRLGVVFSGNRTLNFLERMLSPQWIKKLFSLAPKDTGVSHIEFYNLVSQKELLGQKRTHPNSELLVENFVSLHTPGQPFEIAIGIRNTQPVMALWLSSDGDDTNSEYTVKIQSIELNQQPQIKD